MEKPNRNLLGLKRCLKDLEHIFAYRNSGCIPAIAWFPGNHWKLLQIPDTPGGGPKTKTLLDSIKSIISIERGEMKWKEWSRGVTLIV